jgi:CRP/FNR family cyclic AMP-dependent transcriptional regulator
MTMSRSSNGAAVSMSLAGIALLHDIGEPERKAVEAKCVLRHFAAGEMIVARFGAGCAVYFMLTGVARVVHYLPGEDEITIATVGPGDTIGEIAAIDGLSRSATVIAEKDCAVAELSRHEFRDIVLRHGAVAFALLGLWAKIIRALDDKFSYVSTISPDQRVYAQLVRLARQDASGAGRWVIRDMPSHQHLADRAQTSRESVASALAELLRRGVAERHKKTFIVHDYAALRSLILSGQPEPSGAAAMDA